MPVMNSGWEIVQKYDDLCVGDIVKYTLEVKEYYRKLGRERKSKFIITNLYRNSTERHAIIKQLPDGNYTFSMILSEDMEIRNIRGVKAFERRV